MRLRPKPAVGASRIRDSRSYKNRRQWLLFCKQWLPTGLIVWLLVTLVWYWPRLVAWIDQPIARVAVHGSFYYLAREQVQTLLRHRLKQSFLQLDVKALREELLHEPWIKEATIRKRWPNQLLVVVEEKQPIARWHTRQLVSAEGMIFTPATMPDVGLLPVLTGPTQQAPAIMQQYLTINQLLRPLGMTVNALTLNNTGTWHFQVGAVRVNLGKDQRRERLQRFIQLYHARLKSHWEAVQRIDLRYSNGAAVAWQDKVY